MSGIEVRKDSPRCRAAVDGNKFRYTVSTLFQYKHTLCPPARRLRHEEILYSANRGGASQFDGTTEGSGACITTENSHSGKIRNWWIEPLITVMTIICLVYNLCVESFTARALCLYDNKSSLHPKQARRKAHTRLRTSAANIWSLLLTIQCAALGTVSSEKYSDHVHRHGSMVKDRYEEGLQDRWNFDRDFDHLHKEGTEHMRNLENWVDERNAHSLSVGGPAIPHPNVPAHELQALHDLYNATNGPHWKLFNASFSGVAWDFSPASNPNPCTQRWQGLLCYPAPVNGFLHVIAIDLNLRNLIGTIPESFFNLTKLGGINLATNDLYGTIPRTMLLLDRVRAIDMSNNYLSGPIPDELSQLPLLEAIYFYNNWLSGTLPASLGGLINLHVMKFTLNELTGPIPPEYGNLCNLTLLYLGRNAFNGTIPPELGQLSTTTYFYLYDNQLSGPIPDTLRGLSMVISLDLDVNKLVGTIPEALSTLSTMALLYLNDNELTGTIPQSITNLTILQNLYLHDNLLHGTIPEFLTTMSSLLALELNANEFTGTIPASFADLPALTVLVLEGNKLTGTIPYQLGDMISLGSLSVGTNHLHGTIPSTLGRLGNCTNLYLYENYLTGTIPPEIGLMSSMIYLYLYQNLLTGSIPSTFSLMPDLASFFLQKNQLSGSLNGVFNATNQKFLSLIQVSHNQLTGDLPVEAFKLESLLTFVAVTNCFSGTIPISICNASSLATLALDGLRSAKPCQQLVLPGISNAYVLTNKVRNGIPECLFEMPSLNTLHLCGNGLTGSLSSNLNISDALVDLAISHNKLTGTIPHNVQVRPWYNLDLSYNKFTGTLTSQFGTFSTNVTFLHEIKPGRGSLNFSTNVHRELIVPPPALTLRNNRLSNHVPSSVLSMVNISVLDGNLFDCRLDESDLPANDDAKDTYQCGSTSFNISYYTWLSTMLVLFLLVFTVYYWRQALEPFIGDVFMAVTYVKRWLNIVTWYDQENFRSKSRLHHYKYVVLVSDAVCSFAFYSTMFILLVTLPLYCITSTYYGTHTFEYAWTVSAAFLSGYPALSLLLIFFILLLAALLTQFRFAFRRLRRFLHELPEDFHFSVLEKFDEEETEETKDSRYSSNSEKFLIYSAFFLINFAIVLGVNVAYVYVAIHENSRFFILAQVLLSIFKIGWNNLGSVYLIRWTHHQLAASSTKDWSTKGASFFAIQLFVALFNYIAIPCFVVGAISPNCFNNLLIDAPTVSSHYFFKECDVFSAHFGCVVFIPTAATTSYHPPFTYSYECSSSLITYYAPTFVYMCFIVTFINPCLEVIMQQMHHRLRREGTWFGGQLDYWVPLILHDVSVQIDEKKAPYDIFNPYFDANLLLVTIITYFGVLITFGLVFPPIAVAMVVSIYMVVYSSKLEVGRFMTNAIDQNLHKYLDIIEDECLGVGSIPKLRQCVRMLMVFACFFYTPFLFDTLGDAEGVDGAAWIIVVVPMIPVVMYLGHLIYIYCSAKLQRKSERRSASVTVRKSEFFHSKEAATRLETAIELEKFDPPRTNSDDADNGSNGHNDGPKSITKRESSVTFNILQQKV